MESIIIQIQLTNKWIKEPGILNLAKNYGQLVNKHIKLNFHHEILTMICSLLNYNLERTNHKIINFKS